MARSLKEFPAISYSEGVHGHYYFRVLQIAAIFWHKGSYLVELCSATFAVIFRSLLQTALKLKKKEKETKSNLFLLVFCSYSLLSIDSHILRQSCDE